MCIAADSMDKLRERLRTTQPADNTVEAIDQNAGSHQPTPTMTRREIMEQLTSRPRTQ